MSYVTSNDEVVNHLRRHTEHRKAAAEQAVREATGEDMQESSDGDSPAGG